MATVNFGGLATGMDTNGLIEQLMQIERMPLTRMENEKSYLNSRLSAFTEFETKLEALQEATEAFDSSSELRSYTATVPSEDYVSVTASSSAGKPPLTSFFRAASSAAGARALLSARTVLTRCPA